jgi:iron complex outermembrane receptor protein
MAPFYNTGFRSSNLTGMVGVREWGAAHLWLTAYDKRQEIP